MTASDYLLLNGRDGDPNWLFDRDLQPALAWESDDQCAREWVGMDLGEFRALLCVVRRDA